MALEAGLRLTAAKGGKFPGTSNARGYKEEVKVVACDHLIGSERDAKTGLPEGRPRHHVLVVTKEIDGVSPLLHKAHAEGDTFTECHLNFHRMKTDGAGGEEVAYAVALSGARIVSIRTTMRDVRRSENAQLFEEEEVSFAYEHIAWAWKVNGGSASPAPACSGNEAEVVFVGEPTLLEQGKEAVAALKEFAKKIQEGIEQGRALVQGATPAPGGG